jgi:hypothetical protein
MTTLALDRPLDRPAVAPRFEHMLWLMPAAFAAHIAEEFFGGFSHYVVAAMGGDPMPSPQFLLNNTLFMAILLTLSLWASRRPSRLSAFLVMAWGSGNLFWDFFVHLIYTVATGSFSPGLITATLFYYPLPPLIALLAIRQGRLPAGAMAGAFAIGAALMAFVVWAGVYHFKL